MSHVMMAPEWLVFILASTLRLDAQLNLLIVGNGGLDRNCIPCLSQTSSDKRDTVTSHVDDYDDDTTHDDTITSASPRNRSLRRRQLASLDMSRKLQEQYLVERKAAKQQDLLTEKVAAAASAEKVKNTRNSPRSPTSGPLVFPKEAYCQVKVDVSFAQALQGISLIYIMYRLNTLMHTTFQRERAITQIHKLPFFFFVKNI
jgi:hypothetical protein